MLQKLEYNYIHTFQYTYNTTTFQYRHNYIPVNIIKINIL